MMARFEQGVATIHGARYGLFCNSGTSALQIALAALKERHGWQAGQPITYAAEVAEDAEMDRVAKRNFKAETAVSELQEAGFTSSVEVPGDTLATVAGFDEKDGKVYFLTFKNFYVITRYNRSPLYAMAVYELSEAIRKGYQQ